MTGRAAATGPLKGLRTIELGSTVAGPFCARLLADFGADVIKVEQPEGDAVRSMGTRRDGCSTDRLYRRPLRRLRCADGGGGAATYRKVDGRMVAVVSNDFTVKGASSSLTNMKKIGHVKRVATERGFPLVFFGESSGARMPDNMGARGMGSLLGNDPQQYVRQRETPWASAVLGQCFGSSAWYACLSDFTVMRKGGVLAVASPVLASLAVGEKVEAEELGGWKLHSEVTGLIDRVADSDEDAVAEIRHFLSYMPANCNQAPPRAEVPSGSDEAAQNVLEILPDGRKRGYEVRKIIECLVDRDSFFEFKPRFGRTVVVGLSRLDGRVVGFVANNPMVKAGALDVAGCEKATLREGMRAVYVAAQLSIPTITLVIRKCYGMAGMATCNKNDIDFKIAWPSGEWGSLPVEGGVAAAFRREIAAAPDPKAREKELETELRAYASAFRTAEAFAVEEIIDPRETRPMLCEVVALAQARLKVGLGPKHKAGVAP